MRLRFFASLAVAGSVVVGCGHDISGTTSPIPDLAYVRYVHAMPDTGEVDVHLVDAVENLNFADPSTGYTPYRTVTTYTGISAGSRHFRVFTNMQSTDINVVSQVILTLFFFLFVTPIGLVARLFGKDFLNRKHDLQATTYWIPSEAKAKTPENYERQF